MKLLSIIHGHEIILAAQLPQLLGKSFTLTLRRDIILIIQCKVNDTSWIASCDLPALKDKTPSFCKSKSREQRWKRDMNWTLSKWDLRTEALIIKKLMHWAVGGDFKQTSLDLEKQAKTKYMDFSIKYWTIS